MSWKEFARKKWKWVVAVAAFAVWVAATPIIYQAVLKWFPDFDKVVWAFATKGRMWRWFLC